MKLSIREKIKENIVADIIVSFVLAFCIGFFEPIYIYLGNSTEFWYTPSILLPIIVFVSAILFCVSLLLLLITKLFSRKTHSFLMIVISWGVLGLFVQANYIPDGNGTMDGATIDWSVINSNMVISTVLWILLIGLLVLFWRLKKKDFLEHSIFFISGTIILIGILSLVTLLITNHSFSDKNTYAVTDVGEFELSNRNFIVFILDDFDSGMFSRMVDDEVEKVLEDFTYFPDTMSVYGHTDLSIPQIISGMNYYNQEAYGEYLRKAYDDSPILTHLRDENWSIGIYTECIVPGGVTAEDAINCFDLKTSISSKRRFIEYNYRLVAYYCAPYLLKKYFWFYPDVIKDTQGITEDGYDRFAWDESIFYSSTNIQINAKKPAFRLYHLKGMHEPYETDSKLDKVDYNTSEEEIFRGNILLLNNYLEQLKSCGVYDNSTIIVMSDHGESADATGEWKQNPIFLIKGIDERHHFAISENRISYENLQEIYIRLLEGNNAVNATAILDKDAERIFLRYDFDMNEKEKKEESYFRPIYEYKTKGMADDISALEFTNVKYSHK